MAGKSALHKQLKLIQEAPGQAQPSFPRSLEMHQRIPSDFAFKSSDHVETATCGVQHPESTFFVEVDYIGRANSHSLFEDFSSSLMAVHTTNG